MANLFTQDKLMNLFDKESADAVRIQLEDALKHLLDCEESGRGASVDSLAGSLSRPRRRAAEILGQLRGRGLATAIGDTHQLTEDGRQYALQIVRTHRLYETWLARKTSTPPENWHREAHKAEHHIQAAEVDALANSLNNPRFDPHGDPIPTREGHLPKRQLTALASWPDTVPARIEHIEDEPAVLYLQAQSLGLAPETLIENPRHLSNGAIEALIEGRMLTIPSALTSLIHVKSPQADDSRPVDLCRLSDLPIGGKAVIHKLAPSCTGAERSRLLDLGLVPGTRIECRFASPFGSPRSYDIRGALIALRNNQADRILIHSPVIHHP